MGTRSKDRIKAMIAKDISDISNRCSELKKSMNENLEDTLDYLHALIAQIPQSTSGPLITKTPKVLRKRGVQRIETIPEDDVIDNTILESSVLIKTEPPDVEEVTIGRTKRQASKKAADNIKMQQSLLLNTKLRRPLEIDDDDVPSGKKKRSSRAKRKITMRSSSDEDSIRGPAKHSKIEENVPKENTTKTDKDLDIDNHLPTEETILHQEKSNATMSIRHSNRKRSSVQSHKLGNKKSNTIDDTVIAPTTDEVEEPSMYEDAIGKPTPIMNSTMTLNSTMVMQRMMNATVVLEPLPKSKLNETVTIKKQSATSAESNSERKSTPKDNGLKSNQASKITSPFRKPVQDRMHQLKEAMANKEFDELLTDDESSPEVKKPRQNTKKQEERKRQRRITRSMSSSDDETLSRPAKANRKGVNAGSVVQEMKNTYKSNALFSPYAKESVKKRVEAFEQAGMNSPKLTVEVDAPTRVTRTKTRAIAAAQAEASENAKTMDKTVAQKLARKSLAKAKKISLAKQMKDVDEYKENKVQSAQKTSKILPEKLSQKQQQKTTLLTRIQPPMSVNRIPNTPINSHLNTHYSKALSAPRTNIITSVDSFIQPKTASKQNSSEKKEIEEKKRKLNDEDARRKREEALRLQTEEKRRKRQEKELKNKLAREAKEKQDMEKRQKAEKEREEKARLAQQMQEKQREEMEKKRLAQLQRAQEKEERRRQEEQQRQQRLQEQEEAERVLAEQRRREQEAEKRREAEARVQQQAAAEAMRIKSQMLIAAKYANNKHHGPTNYILDSEPDDDESDDEARPKHLIPYWAQPHVRKTQLAMQLYVPEEAIFKFFDTRKCTPDLTELFHGIDRSRLKRTSSAIWKTPPRYSMMEAE